MRFRKPIRALFIATSVAAAGALWAGCSPKKQTELVPGVSTQVRVPKDLKSIRLDAVVGGVSAFCGVYDVTNGVARLPRTLALQSLGKGQPVTIYVTGFKHATTDPDATPDQSACALTPIPSVKDLKNPDGTVRILRAARTQYLQDHVLFVPMPLKFSCFDKGCPLDQNKVCKAGKCVDITDEKNLADYNDNLVFGNSSTCFSAARCLPDAVIPIPVDPATCKYALPKTKGAPDGGAAFPFETHGDGLNVRAYYDDGSYSEVLDLDPAEGFFVPDPAGAPQTFQLAEGLCHPDGDTPHRIVGLVASGLCASKTALQPICDEESPSNPDSDASAPEDPTSARCTSLEIKPAPSALVVLLDDTSDMSPFYGATGAKQVLNLSLKDPAFENTIVGLDFFPRSGDQCTTSSYGTTLDSSFKLARDAQGDLAKLLNDRSSSLSAPPRQLDAALSPQGAYRMLADLSAQSAVPFNKLGVLVISNGNFDKECTAGNPLANNAAAARALGISTYTIVVGRQALGANTSGVNNAALLAGAGGTPPFNADDQSGGKAENGLDALGVVTTDLASCVYEIPGNRCQLDATGKLTCTGGTAVQGTRDVTYFNPLPPLPGQVRVKYNAACSSAPGNTASGWNLDATGRVRICGSDCTNLRDVLKNSAKLAEVLGQPPPAIPIHVSNCQEAPTPKPDGGAAEGGSGSDGGGPPKDASVDAAVFDSSTD